MKLPVGKAMTWLYPALAGFFAVMAALDLSVLHDRWGAFTNAGLAFAWFMFVPLRRMAAKTGYDYGVADTLNALAEAHRNGLSPEAWAASVKAAKQQRTRDGEL